MSDKHKNSWQQNTALAWAALTFGSGAIYLLVMIAQHLHWLNP